MTIDLDQIDIRDNVAEGQFETEVNGHTAVAAYVRNGNTITFTHTEVPEEFRGLGVAAKLVRFALEQATSEGLRVVPRCPYVADFIAKHAEYQPLVSA